MPQSGVGSMQGSIKVVFHWRSSSTTGSLPPKVVFQQRSSSREGCLPLKVLFHQRSSSTKCHLSRKVVFHRRSSSIEGRLPQKVVFHWRSSSTKGCLSLTISPWLILYLWEPSTYQISASYLQCMMFMHDALCNTLVDLIFVRTFSIPNLSLLPCLEVA